MGIPIDLQHATPFWERSTESLVSHIEEELETNINALESLRDTKQLDPGQKLVYASYKLAVFRSNPAAEEIFYNAEGLFFELAQQGNAEAKQALMSLVEKHKELVAFEIRIWLRNNKE
tara:strand:- start:45677 stop:46030 length:354 start_codon:yes stop_codon:yes gene_type:complete